MVFLAAQEVVDFLRVPDVEQASKKKRELENG